MDCEVSANGILGDFNMSFHIQLWTPSEKISLLRIIQTTEVVRPCDETERAAHSENNAMCATYQGQKKWAGQTKDGHMHVREI